MAGADDGNLRPLAAVWENMMIGRSRKALRKMRVAVAHPVGAPSPDRSR